MRLGIALVPYQGQRAEILRSVRFSQEGARRATFSSMRLCMFVRCARATLCVHALYYVSVLLPLRVIVIDLVCDGPPWRPRLNSSSSGRLLAWWMDGGVITRNTISWACGVEFDATLDDRCCSECRVDACVCVCVCVRGSICLFV